jgi:hemerythrin-like domain-containing protein
MIPNNNLPNLAGDLLRIHRAITRGLTVGVTRGSDFVREGFPDQSLQQGFALYLQALTAVVSAHHLGEDDVAFPALKQKLPAVPYERLGADHITIETALNLMKSALPELAGANSAAAWVKVVDGLKSILAVWNPHIEVEQNAFSSTAIAGVMTPAEQAQLSIALAKHSQEHVGQPFLGLPFVLFNLAPADRAEMAATMPKMLVQELIPGEWKEKWAPMKPFLLD